MRASFASLLVAAGWLGLSAAPADVRTAENVGAWSRDGKETVSSPSAGVFDFRHCGGEDWAVKWPGEFTASAGEIFRLSCDASEIPGVPSVGGFQVSAVVRDAAGKEIAWCWGKTTGKPGQSVSTEFAVPAGGVAIVPRIVGVGQFAGRFSRLTVVRTGLNIYGERPCDGVSFASGALRVSVSGKNGAISVTDSRTGRTWAPPLGKSARGFAATSIERTGEGSVRIKLVEPEHLTCFSAVVTADSKRKSELLVAIEGKGRMRPLPWPEPFATKKGDRLILPMGEGMGFPVDEHHPMLEGAHVTYGGNSLSMSFFGIAEDASGSGWMAIVETPDDAAVSVTKSGGNWVAGPEWHAQKNEFGYRRLIRYAFQDKGAHVAMCKRYRDYAKAKGMLKTFAEKAKERPNVDRLLGAVNVWSWEWNPKDAMSLFAEMRSAGIRRMLWSAAGCASNVTEMAKIPEVLVGCYDNYQDVWSPEQAKKLGWGKDDCNTEAWPRDVIWSGPTSNELRRAWSVRAKDGTWEHAATMCERVAPEYLRRKLAVELPAKPYNARFIDTTLATAWRECWNPQHPMTRTDSREWRIRLLRVLTDEHRFVVGAESGHDAAVPWCDYCEGMLSIDAYRVPESGRNLTVVWTNAPANVVKYQVGERYRLPLWELVYHDCLCAHWYWGDYNNKLPQFWRKRDLFNALYGTMGMFLLTRRQWEADKARFVRSYESTSPIARATGYSEMLDHEILTADRSVQRTVFADGTTVTVNFGEKPHTLEGGAVIDPVSIVVRRW